MDNTLKKTNKKDIFYYICFGLIAVGSIYLFKLDCMNIYLTEFNTDALVMIILYLIVTSIPVILVWKSKCDIRLKIIASVLLTLTFLIRIFSAEYRSGDYLIFLEDWVAYYRERTFLEGLAGYVGNYSPPYNLILQIIAHIPVRDLFLIKVVSYVFEMMAAVVIVKTVAYIKQEKPSYWLLGVILMIPMFYIDSSFWAQCDAVYTFFLILALYFAVQKKSKSAFFTFGVAFAFKMQSLVVFPVVLVILLSKPKENQEKMMKWRDIYFAVIGYVAFTIFPVFFGRSIENTFLVYLKQASTNEGIVGGAASYLSVLKYFDIFNTKGFVLFQFLLVAVILSVLLYYCIKYVRKNGITEYEVILFALMISFIVVYFMPKMLERFFYVSNLLLVIVALVLKRKDFTLTALLSLIANHIRYTRYNRVFTETIYTVTNCIAAAVNTIAFVLLCIIFIKYLKENMKRKEEN